MYHTKCIRSSKTLIFTRVNLKNTQTAAEWRRHHARSTQHTHKSSVPKERKKCQQQKDTRGGSSFYVDKRPSFEISCNTSAAVWELRGIGASTIIYCKETITFKNNKNNKNFCNCCYKLLLLLSLLL